MPSLLDKVVALHMQRLFKRNGQWTAVPNCEDAENQRDDDRLILDADEAAHTITAQSDSGAAEVAAATECLTDVPLVDVPAAALLGGKDVTSDSQQAPDTAKASKKSKSLLSCLHLSKKTKKEETTSSGQSHGLPTAFNDRQSILKRLARSAKKAPSQVAERPVKPPKKNPFALHAAAWRTNLNELLEQLANGADVARRDKAGLTPLHYAAWQGSVDAVELLLEKGANVNVADPEGMLPIHFAAWFNRLDVAALLLDKGSMVNPPTKGLMWPTTPLIYAAKMGHKDMAGLLMDRGAQVAATYKAASSALHEAAWGGHADVVAEMMRRNVSHDLSTSKSKYRALHLAAMSGSAAVVAELLSHGAWVDARSQLGRTPLHLACEKGHVAAATALVAGGADLLAKDRHGFTPLHLAVDNNHVQLAKLLLDKGATPDAADSHGALPLNFAHDPDFFKLLRAVRWYGAASVPSGNNPSSSRYISTYTRSAEPDSSAPAATVAADAHTPSASKDTDQKKAPAANAAAAGSPGSAGGWIKAHLPHIRSHKAAVAAAAAQPGTAALTTPESLAGSSAAVAVAAPAAIIAPVTKEPAVAAPAAIATPLPASLGKVSPAGSASSGESAAAQAAAVNLAREAVKAVVARAAAEAAAEEAAVQLVKELQGMGAVAQTAEPEIMPASPLEPRAVPAGDSPVPEGAGGGYLSRERDSTDDARLLQQIRSALSGAGGNLSATTDSPAEDEDVKLEYFLRAPASIGIDAPSISITASRTPSTKAPSPSNDGDVQERTDGDQAKHTAATTVSPAARASPDIPVSTSAENELADDHHLAADVAFTAAPTAAAAAPPVKATAKSSAAAAAIAAKKSKTSSSKRKSKASTTTSGAARVTRVL